MTKPRCYRITWQCVLMLLLLPPAFFFAAWSQNAWAAAAIPVAGPETSDARVILVGSRYSSRSTATLSATPVPRRGLSDSTYNGGYGFTRKSFFKNSENNRSHFRNGFAKRSDFGHRYDRTSKLRLVFSPTPPGARPLPAIRKLELWQPSDKTSLPGTSAAGRAYAERGRANPLLTADEIEKLLSGRGVLLEVAELGRLDVRFGTDGTIEARRKAGEAIGAWETDESRLCIAVTRSPGARCYHITNRGPVLTFFMASGAPAGRAYFHRGGS